MSHETIAMTEAADHMMGAAELFARSVAALGEIEGMKAANAHRASIEGEFASVDYDQSAFEEVIARYEIKRKPQS